MAWSSCYKVERIIRDCIKTGHLDSSTKDHLQYARSQLNSLWHYLYSLEKINSQYWVSAQLEPLFDEAYRGFCEILGLLKNQGLTSDRVRMISDVLQILKPEIIAGRISPFKQSRYRSSSRITMDMVNFVAEACLDGVAYLIGYYPRDDPIRKALRKLKYLGVFLKFTAKRCNIEHEKMKDLFTLAEDIATTAAYLSILCQETHDEHQARVSAPDCPSWLTHVMHGSDFASKLSKLVERIDPIKPEWRNLYISVLKASHYSVAKARMMDASLEDLSHDLDLAWKFTRCIRYDLADLKIRDSSLKIAFSDRFEWLQDGLIHLSEFHMILARHKDIQHRELSSVLSFVEALAKEAAIAIYTMCDVDLEKITEVNHVSLSFQLKFNYLKVEISLIQKPRLPESQMDYFQEEVTFMKTFLKVTLEQCKEQTQITDILTLVQSVTTEAQSFLNSLSHDSEEGELAWKINLLHFQFLLKFKFIKATIRQIYPFISASSTPDHPVIYPLNFLPTYFEVIDSYFTMLKSSKTSSSSGNLKIDEVFMGFHEYIFENLLLKDEADLKLADTDKVKRVLLFLVTFLVDPPIQYIECKKQNCPLTETGTLAIQAEAAIRLSCEDALDNSKTRKVRLLLQILAVAFKIIKCEGKFKDQLKHKATLEAQFLDLVGNAYEELIFLRSFLMDLLRHQTELKNLDDLIMRAEVISDKASLIIGSHYGSFLDGSSTGEMSLPLSDFLQEIKSANVEVRESCFQLLEESACYISVTDLKGLIDILINMMNHLLHYGYVISFVRNQIPVVQEKLKCLRDFLACIFQDSNMHRELKDLMGRVQTVACEEKYVILFSVSGDSRAWFHLLYLSNVKHVLNFVEAESKAILCKRRDITLSFPKTNGLGFLNCFLGKLEVLLHSKLDQITELKPQIESVKEGLLCLKLSYDHLEETYDEHDEDCGLTTSVTEMAYKAEYVVDSCLASSYSLWYKAQWISEVVENIKLVDKAINENFKRKKIHMDIVEKGSTNLVSSLSIAKGANEEVVGFQDVMDKIKQQLLGGSHQLDVISIFGMPGNGKTTLAKKIYNDPVVGSHFDVRAMCHVTQVYSQRELLLTILNDVLGPADRTKKRYDQLATELRRVLLIKRFLIFIDDVWDTTAWDYLHMCFQGSQNRSRIILTTRLYEVAHYAKCKSDPHQLRLLTDDESCKLLHEELFHGQGCPTELGDVGLQIAKSCGGLPLFIVLVAGVLKEKKKRAESWKEVQENLGSHNFVVSEEGMSIIGFSYKNLPHHLKPCFLYFGVFLRGKDIPVSKLSRLWSAEGIVEDRQEKGPEDVAQGYLKDLTRRNLVTDMKKKSNGKLKTCRVHDLLHQFCVEKAKQDNFLHWIHRDQCGDSILYPEMPEEYRLSIYSKRDEFSQWGPCSSSVRSLLFNATNDDSYPTMPRDISFIFNSFKLLKVLDLETINIGDTFPCEIRALIHMRYFAARTGADSIPSAIADLWNLETFVVKGLRGELRLPRSLFKMFKLKHIHVDSRASFSLHDDICESLDNSRLNSLESFSTPRLSYGEDAEKILRSMPNLRKLRCIFQESWGYSRKFRGNCVFYPILNFLNQLESLKLLSNSVPAKHPHVFNFPSKLRELTLSNFRLPWSQILTTGELPNLKILKLLFRAFEGDEWEVKDSDFPELKYLKLDNLNIAQWSVSEDAFPKLEHLVLTKCKRLEKIPFHFEDVVSLKSIEVNWCSWSVANSAQEIQTKQHDEMENHAFAVTIQPPDWATRSSP